MYNYTKEDMKEAQDAGIEFLLEGKRLLQKCGFVFAITDYSVYEGHRYAWEKFLENKYGSKEKKYTVLCTGTKSHTQGPFTLQGASDQAIMMAKQHPEANVYVVEIVKTFNATFVINES